MAKKSKKKDLDIKEIKLEAFGKKGKVKAYEREDKIICLEASLLDFAYKVGLTEFRIENVFITEDNLWTAGGELMTSTIQSIVRESTGTNLEEKITINKSFVKGPRYIVTYGVTTPDGKRIIDLGSAGADNTSLEFRRYAPEIAARRARVRTILTAINKKELLTDIEMPPDFIGPKVDEEEEERNNNGLCSPEQISALKNLYKSKEKMETLLKKYNVEKIEDLSHEKAGEAIRQAQRRPTTILKRTKKPMNTTSS